jgi:uncharacterized protein YcfJ
MRKMLTILALLGLAAAGSAVAQPGPVHYIHAPVVDVRPIHASERVPVEREVCWQARERARPRSATGTIAGAIIGGVIGNQFGDGNGRRALTAAGAALGASIGHDASRRPGYRRVERCEIQVDYETRRYTAGFDVHYEYNGEIFVTRTHHHPGDTIRLVVAARPVE